MASVYKREADKARGKRGKWTMAWVGEDGRQHTKVGFTDRAESLKMAEYFEREAEKVRAGLVEPGEAKRHSASLRPVADHLRDFENGMLAKGDVPKHARGYTQAARRLLDSASVASIVDIAPDRIQEALGRLKTERSARTCNYGLSAVNAFVAWLHANGRIKDIPRGLILIKPYPEKADRRRERRALVASELVKLLESTEQRPTINTRRDPRTKKVIGTLTGPERAIVYQIAMATGFRAEEIRTLTPERFNLDGDNPTITCLACYSKRGKRSGRDDVQPIRRDFAAMFKKWLDSANADPDRPVLALPEKAAEMLRADLEAAGIPYVDHRGHVVDFHALRHSYITALSRAGVNPKVIQRLARHSTITLTLDRYCHVEDGDLRDALEGMADD